MAYELAHPSEKLTFSNDWTADLVGAETVASRLWTVDPEEGSPAQPSLTGATGATVTIAEMRAGIVYRLTEKVTTSAGRILTRSTTIRCEI